MTWVTVSIRSSILTRSFLISLYLNGNIPFPMQVINVHWNICTVYTKSISVQNYFKGLSRMWLSWRQPLLHKWIFRANTTTSDMSDVHWHIHQCLTEFPTNGLNIFPFQIVLDDCGNSSFQLFFPHILIDIWTQRNTVNVINETRFEKENYYSLTVEEH